MPRRMRSASWRRSCAIDFPPRSAMPSSVYVRSVVPLGRVKKASICPGTDRLSALFRGGRPIDAELLGELEELLYTSDLGPLASELVDSRAALGVARDHRQGDARRAWR